MTMKKTGIKLGRRQFLAGGLTAVVSATSTASRLENVEMQNPVKEPDVRMPPTNLRCEYLVDPTVIDVQEPRLFWEIQDARRGVRQTAYRILVASSAETLSQDRGDMWDSGRIESDETIHITYKGSPLKSRMCCYWKVKVWLRVADSIAAEEATPWSKPAMWSMGLLDPSDWQAKWIADPSPIPPRISPHLGYHSGPASAPDTQKWVTLDLKTLSRVDAVCLFGVSNRVHGFLFPLRFRVDVSHRPDFSEFKTVWDETAKDFPNPGVQPLTCRFSPETARYVRLTATRLRPDGEGSYGFALAEMAVLNQDTNLARDARVIAPDSTESDNWSAQKLVDGDITSHPAGVDRSTHNAIGQINVLPPPVLRREFTIAASIRSATIYVSALGLYELRINGQRVGDHILAPEWTDYEKCVNYQTYDVINLLRTGENAVGVLLGDGWYAGRIAHIPFHYLYGNAPHFKAQLEIEFTDGTSATIVTDGTWRSTLDGPIRRSGIYEGEVYDARQEMPGWDKPGFNDSEWRPSVENNHIRAALIAQMSEPIRIMQELPANSVSEPHPSVYVFDLGQNMVGWVRFKLRASPGKTIRLRHSEMLAPDGTLYTAYHRTAFQDDHYIAKGDPQGETFEPHFTFHGFRYVEVSGLDYEPEAKDLVGQVFHSSTRQTGFLETSSTLVNKVWENTMWTQRGNLQGVLIDCPQRDERLPWVCGDYHSYSHTSLSNMDMAASYVRRARDIRQSQYADGRYPNMAPNVFGWSTSPGWGDEGALVPWVTYLHYGDRRILEEHFESAVRWVEWIRSQTNGLIWDQAGPGDWLNADHIDVPDLPRTGAEVGHGVFATTFFAYSTRLISKMAAALGRSDESRRYEELFQSIRQAFNNKFVDRDGRIEGDTQAGYALALHFDLLPEGLREQALHHMIDGIERYQGHVSTGFIATHRMLLELSRRGYNEKAYELMHVRTCPSWGFMIDQNATTIWERWDGFVPGRALSAGKYVNGIQLPLVTGFQDTWMTSFNHCALGSVVEWMYRVILGIEPDEQNPGYKHFTIKPQPGKRLNFAQGAIHSIRGKIEVQWTRESGVLKLDVRIPPSTTATLHVPAKDQSGVREGGKPATQAFGVQFVRMDDATAIFEVVAGLYHFESDWN